MEISTSLLMLAMAAHGAHAEKPSLPQVRVEVTPTEARLGDVFFLRVSLRNDAKVAIPVPEGCLPEFELEDPEEDTKYTFLSGGMGCGPPPRKVLLEPGQTRVVSYSLVRLPRLDRINFRFWNPKSWRRSEYWLSAHCAGTSGFSDRDVSIGRRPKKEMAALLEYYDGGYETRVPLGYDAYRPSLGVFGLLSFPVACSAPTELAAMEKKLSPGSLRDIVHATRLTAELYDAKTIMEKREVSTRLLRWLDKRPEIQRHIMAGDLYRWARANKGLKEYSFEFIDQIIPRFPKSFQEKCRKSNNDSRKRYLEYLRTQKESPPAASNKPAT